MGYINTVFTFIAIKIIMDLGLLILSVKRREKYLKEKVFHNLTPEQRGTAVATALAL